MSYEQKPLDPANREERIEALKTMIPVGFRPLGWGEVWINGYFWHYEDEDGFLHGTWEHCQIKDPKRSIELGTIFVVAETVIPEAPLPVEIVTNPLGTKIEVCHETVPGVFPIPEAVDDNLKIRQDAAKNLSEGFLARLAQWEKLEAEIANLKDQENTLRKELFEEMFPSPVEGTNTFKLHAGHVVKATFKINRTVDKAALGTVREMLAELNVSLDDAIRMKPELDLKGYKAMSSEARKVMDLAITAKPGTPSMEIVLPKRAS